MSQRVKIMGSFALLGFLMGIAVYLAYNWAIPILIELFPQILSAGWLLWGLVGALLSETMLLLWATFPKQR